MRTKLVIKKLAKALLVAKECQAELVAIHGDTLSVEGRKQVVDAWNSIDEANLAIHKLCKIEGITI